MTTELNRLQPNTTSVSYARVNVLTEMMKRLMWRICDFQTQISVQLMFCNGSIWQVTSATLRISLVPDAQEGAAVLQENNGELENIHCEINEPPSAAGIISTAAALHEWSIVTSIYKEFF